MRQARGSLTPTQYSSTATKRAAMRAAASPRGALRLPPAGAGCPARKGRQGGSGRTWLFEARPPPGSAAGWPLPAPRP
eukprot:15470478-Alexandrium_andersonii.AAC.1